jgi:tetratricopeptide (TPR) repeat protein
MLPVLILISSLSLQAPAPAPDIPAERLGQVYSLVLQSRILEGRGLIDAAVAALRRATGLAPELAALHGELASLYMREDRPQEAAASARAALAIDPGQREAHRILGLIQAGQASQQTGPPADRLMDDAIGHLEQAIEGAPRDPGTLLALSQAYLRRGRYDDAVMSLEAFMRTQPGYPEATLMLSAAHEGAGSVDRAAEVLEELVIAEPNYLRGRVAAAELYERLGRWDEAARHWGGAAGDRSEAGYRLNQAAALINGERLEAARDTLREIVADVPDEIPAWYLLAVVERRLDNPTGAEAAARRIAAIDPEDARGLLAQAHALAAREDHRGVIELLQPRVDAARPRDVSSGMFARLVSELVAAYEQAGEPARAIQLLERAREEDAELLFALGAAYERHDRIDQAERAFRELIRRDPDHAGALNYLGYMLADRGERLDEAVAFVQRALDLDRNNPAYLDSLGWAFFKQGRLDEARGPLERAAAALPTVSVIQDHLGDLYLQLKRYSEAVRAFEQALAGDREDLNVTATSRKLDEARRLARQP